MIIFAEILMEDNKFHRTELSRVKTWKEAAELIADASNKFTIKNLHIKGEIK